MKIVDLEDYMDGKKFSRIVNAPYRASEDDFNRWVDIMRVNEMADRFIKLTESVTQFFAIERDIAELVPKKEREEMFFSMRNGLASPCIPAKCIYYIKKAYDKYKICNLITKLIPERELNVMLSKNYIGGGFTLADVIRQFCDEHYNPVSNHNLSVDFGEFHEVYIPDTDMIAAIPSKIASGLSHEDICNIHLDTFGLELNGSYIGLMAGYNGACNSKYDLRRLV